MLRKHWCAVRAKCRVCGTLVTCAADGVVFRVKQVEAALCTKHAQLAQLGAVKIGESALRSVAEAFKLQPDHVVAAARTITGLYEMLKPPVRLAPSTQRAKPKVVDDIIDAEFEIIP